MNVKEVYLSYRVHHGIKVSILRTAKDLHLTPAEVSEMLGFDTTKRLVEFKDEKRVDAVMDDAVNGARMRMQEDVAIIMLVMPVGSIENDVCLKMTTNISDMDLTSNILAIACARLIERNERAKKFN